MQILKAFHTSRLQQCKSERCVSQSGIQRAANQTRAQPRRSLAAFLERAEGTSVRDAQIKRSPSGSSRAAAIAQGLGASSSSSFASKGSGQSFRHRRKAPWPAFRELSKSSHLKESNLKTKPISGFGSSCAFWTAVFGEVAEHGRAREPPHRASNRDDWLLKACDAQDVLAIEEAILGFATSAKGKRHEPKGHRHVTHGTVLPRHGWGHQAHQEAQQRQQQHLGPHLEGASQSRAPSTELRFVEIRRDSSPLSLEKGQGQLVGQKVQQLPRPRLSGPKPRSSSGFRLLSIFGARDRSICFYSFCFIRSLSLSLSLAPCSRGAAWQRSKLRCPRTAPLAEWKGRGMGCAKPRSPDAVPGLAKRPHGVSRETLRQNFRRCREPHAVRSAAAWRQTFLSTLLQ